MGKKTVAIVLGAVVVAGVAGVAAGRQWDRDPSTPTSVATTTTAVETGQPPTAMWPYASTATRFHDPVVAAQSFATHYLGMVSPLVGSFQRGDSRSGEVPVRATPSGPVTTVLLRQLTSSNSWWVLGAACPDIIVTSPSALTGISSPVEIKGQSTAYEGVINVEVRQDGSLAPLRADTVIGGSMGVMGPFSKYVSFYGPTTSAGALLFRTLSAKDGAVLEASAIRVAFLG